MTKRRVHYGPSMRGMHFTTFCGRRKGIVTAHFKSVTCATCIKQVRFFLQFWPRRTP